VASRHFRRYSVIDLTKKIDADNNDCLGHSFIFLTNFVHDFNPVHSIGLELNDLR
jgi:hypothetical protein